MSMILEQWVGKSVSVTLRIVFPVRFHGTISEADDSALVLDQLKNKGQILIPMTSIRVLLVTWLLAMGTVAAQQPTNVVDDGLEAAAQRFVTLMNEGEFEKAIAKFDATMARLVPASKLEPIWKGVAKCRSKAEPVRLRDQEARQPVARNLPHVRPVLYGIPV